VKTVLERGDPGRVGVGGLGAAEAATGGGGEGTRGIPTLLSLPGEKATRALATIARIRAALARGRERGKRKIILFEWNFLFPLSLPLARAALT